jgi:hypothetical protein
MVEAVRTTQSTFGIWAIVAVAMICLAAWLIGVYVADSQQTRLSRMRRRMLAQGPVLHEAEASAATASIPGQRREAGQPEPAPEATQETAAARGRHARPSEYYAAADYYEKADYKAAETPPAGLSEVRPRGVSAETGQADAPTLPDLPAQPGQPAEPGRPAGPGQPAEQAPTGRHAMPAQRSGDTDRAERTYAGPDANREDDEDQQ